MRRTVGVVLRALLIALIPAFAGAAVPSLDSVRPSLASQLMLSVFGEISDSTATFAARGGDRASESPLRDLALAVRTPQVKSSFAPASAQGFGQAQIAIGDLTTSSGAYTAADFNPGAIASVPPVTIAAPATVAAAASIPRIAFTIPYQPVAPRVSPDPGTLAFDSDAVTLSQPALTVPDYTAARSSTHRLDLHVNGAYQDFGSSNLNASGTSAASAWVLPSDSETVGVPNYGGSNKLSIGAGVAVPVFRGLTLNFNYDAQRLLGGYALPGLMNIDAANNVYTGGFTYHLPQTSSALSISAYQNRMGQSVLPGDGGFTQTGENVNFTVKF